MDDEQLVQQVLRGESRAFEVLVLRHQRPLFHYLGRMGLDAAETEDLAQEAFLRAYRHLHRFDPRRARFSTWLFTIARRCTDYRLLQWQQPGVYLALLLFGYLVVLAGSAGY